MRTSLRCIPASTGPEGGPLPSCKGARGRGTFLCRSELSLPPVTSVGIVGGSSAAQEPSDWRSWGALTPGAHSPGPPLSLLRPGPPWHGDPFKRPGPRPLWPALSFSFPPPLPDGASSSLTAFCRRLVVAHLQLSSSSVTMLTTWQAQMKPTS